MTKIKIGVCATALSLPLRKSLQAIQQLNVAGVEFDAAGELAPNNLSQTGRREIRNLLKTQDMELAALGCPLRHGLTTADNMEARLQHVQNVMTMSYDLGPRIVLVEAGAIPDESDPAHSLLVESLRTLGAFGDRAGVVLALETGLNSGDELATFLKQFETAGLGAFLNPANMLINGHPLPDAMRSLHEQIVYCRASDARRSSANRSGAETVVGHGDIDWMHFIGLLEEIDYRGWLTVKRHDMAEIQESVGFLRRFVR